LSVLQLFSGATARLVFNRYSAVTQANTASEITLTATMAATIQTMQTFPNEWVVVLILTLLRNLALFT